MFLRDIIDLEATYAGPDAKNNMATNMAGNIGQDMGNGATGGAMGPDGQPSRTAGSTSRRPRSRRFSRAAAAVRSVGLQACRCAEAADGEDGEGAEGGETPPGDGDFDDDDMENSLSLAAIEAELKPKVVETFDKIADAFKRLRRLQDQDIQLQLKSDTLSPAQERKYKKLKEEIIAEVKSLRLNQGRIDALVEQLYDINKRLVGYEGRLMRLSESYGVVREDFLKNYQGSELDPRWLNRVSKLSAKGWKNLVAKDKDKVKEIRGQIHELAGETGARDRRIPQDRAHGAEGRARSPPGEEGNGGGEPAPRHLHRQEVHQPRPAVPRPDPGRQHRPDEGGRQVRVPPRLQVLDLRHLVDPAGDHPLDRRPGAHHPHPGAHDRDDQQDRPHLAPDAATRSAASRPPRSWPRSSACRSRRCARSSRSPRSRSRSRRRSATRRTCTSATSSRTRTRSCRSTRRSSRNLRETTTRVLASLTPREERVLRMRFGIGMNTDHTLEEVGQQFSVTRERIRQIEAKALRKLKHPSR